MADSDRARFLSDQAFAFLGFAFASFSPQLAILVAIALSPVHAFPLPLHGLALMGIPLAFVGVLVLVLFDDLLVSVFVLAAIVRYEAVYALGAWPLQTRPTMFNMSDWSSRKADALARAESWFFELPYRLVGVTVVMVLFLGITSGYLLWLVLLSV